MPDSPFLKFRQILQSWFQTLEYGKVVRPNRWDGDDPQDELSRILTSRELFADFVDTRRLEAILLDENEMDREEFEDRLRNVVRRPRRRYLSQETKLIFDNLELVNDGLLAAATEYRKDYRPVFLIQSAREVRSGESMPGKDRRALVDSYLEEVHRLTGKPITRTAIWKKAGYTTRTEFERWERNDRRATETADRRFMRLLQIDKPHLK